MLRSDEDRLSAAFEEGIARLSELVDRAVRDETRWLDRVRAGLVALLWFLADEPRQGRLLFLRAPEDGTAAFRREQRVLGVLSVLLDDGSPQAIAELTPEPQLTTELVIGGVFSVLRARMAEGAGGSLIELAPSLMSFIAVAYLGQAAASAELVGGQPVHEHTTDDARALEIVERAPVPRGGRAPLTFSSPPIPVTHRTTMVLSAIARAPRSSNREIAAASGIADDGQISHLLRRLSERGLIEKVQPRSGSRRENAWLLTSSGRRVVELLGFASPARAGASARARVREAA